MEEKEERGKINICSDKRNGDGGDREIKIRFIRFWLERALNPSPSPRHFPLWARWATSW
jgi:hypothetical protein